ncbi:MAG: hypothetical protein E6Q83_03625 [Thiothrix sp.]|nr:MAG: hypothetical protein E6Q83_03625 [Thiothrix sp.]
MLNDEFVAKRGGAFFIQSLKLKQALKVIASVEEGWEHVSVSLGNRCPTWDEEDMVIQFHPAKSEYVNLHPHALHLWRKENSNDYVEKPAVSLL